MSYVDRSLPGNRDEGACGSRDSARRHTDNHDCITELNGAIDTSFIGVVAFRRRHDVNVRVDEVQMVPDGFGFHLQASEYTWVTLVFDTKDEAKAAHSHAAKAVANAKALKLVNR